jgi:hypothetical protein
LVTQEAAAEITMALGTFRALAPFDTETRLGFYRTMLRARSEVDEATETARNSLPPSEDVAGIDVWADGGSVWRN